MYAAFNNHLPFYILSDYVCKVIRDTAAIFKSSQVKLFIFANSNSTLNVRLFVKLFSSLPEVSTAWLDNCDLD